MRAATLLITDYDAHWCLLGKIVDFAMLIRLRIEIKDVDGVKFRCTCIPMAASHNPWIETKFVGWLVAFCGEDYFPYITFATTHWSCIVDQQLAQYQYKLEQRKIKWKRSSVRVLRRINMERCIQMA